jgi:uncharacterized protein YjiS (DUF1127 family)
MSVFAKIQEARRRRLAIRDLRGLSPQILSDIGIEPDQIDNAVSEAIRSNRAARRSPAFAAPLHGSGAWPYPWRRAG